MTTVLEFAGDVSLFGLRAVTDPESRIMHSPDGFMQAYNVQVAVHDLQLIVGQAVTQETNDKHQLVPMIRTIEQQAGATPTQLLADAGYCSDENLAAINTTIDAYISTWNYGVFVAGRFVKESQPARNLIYGALWAGYKF